MADFNLSAEVSMDVDPLKASKTTIERNLKEINKSLRNQRKEFKQNEVSAEALAKQETDLGRAVKLQEGLLKQRNKTLNDMQRQMKESNNVTDEQKLKLQNASRAVQQAENQLNNYENELKQTQTQQKLLGRTTDQVKNSLGRLRDQAKLSETTFKQSTKSVNDYQNHLTTLNHTISKSEANIKLLKGNLNEVSRAQGASSRAADKLRNDLAKEAVMMQVAKGRADELGDELDELKRKQHGLVLSTKLMGAGWKGARGSMDRMATTLRSLGELTQGVVGGVMTAHFSALVPILGSVVSLGAGLGGMLTAAAGGAIGMGGAFGIAGVAVKAFAGQATYALKMLEDGQLRVTKEVSAYQTALSGLKTSWEGLIAQNQAAIFNTMTNGINTAKYALTSLNPFLTKTASQIETASGKMLNWAKTSSVAKRSLDILNTQGPKIFQHLLNATQSFVNGSAALFNKLSPLYGWAAKGFADMAKSFDNWANSVEGSKAINGFVEYTKVNLPIVGSIFGNIFSGIISLFQAFSGHSHNVLLGIQDVTKGFAEWSEGLKKSDGFQQFVQYLETNGPKVWSIIKNITGTLWGLVKGMAPVGAAVLSVSNAFFKWTNEMTNAHPMIGKILGYMTAIAGIGLLAAKPFFMVGGALMSMRRALLAVTGAEMLFGKAGAFATLQTNRQRLATKLLGNEGLLASAKMKIAAAATKVWTLVSKGAALATRGLGLAIRFMTGPIGWVITAIGLLVAGIVHLWKTNATFRNAVIAIWNSIKAAAISVFGFLKPYIIAIWNGIKTATIVVWNAIKNTAITVWNAIKFAVQNPIQALKNILSAIWNGIKAAAIWIWNTLKTGVVNIVKALVNGVKWYITTVKTVISTVFNAAKAIAIRIWTTIKNTVVNLAKGLWTGVKTAFNWLKKGVISIFNAVKNFTIKVWTTIKNAVVSRAKTLWTGVRVAFNGLKKSVISIFNSVKNFAIKVWTTIKNTVISRAKSLWNGVRTTFNALKKGVISIFNSVKNFAVKVWTNIRNGVVSRAKSLWNGVRNTFNALRKGVQNIFTSVKNFVFKIWTSIRNNVISKAKSLWNGVRNTWNSLKKGTINLFNSVASFLSKKWSAIKSSTVSKAKALWSGVKGAWGSLTKGTRNTMNAIGGFMSKKWKDIKSGTVDLVTGMKDKITGVMNKMGDVIKSVTGKIGDFFGDMIKGVKTGLNKLIEGVNWVGGKLGMDKLPKIKLHTGTEHTNTTTNVVKNGKIARDTFATVGDRGRGNGPGGFRHEAIKYPNGKMALTPNRDTTTFLPQGSTVYNGAQTHAMLSNSNPTFSKGTLPKFDSGTLSNKKPKKKKKDDEFFGDVWDKTKDGAKVVSGKVVEGGKAVVNKSLEVAAKGKKWLGDKVGDVMDWIEKPGKLLDKVLEGFGVNLDSFGISKAASLPYDMMKGMFGKLKKSAIDTFTSWMEEQGGGDGGYIDLSKGINFPFSPHGRAPGYPFPYPHMGVDLNYVYDKLYSVASGTATAKTTAGGFGKHMWIKKGNMDYIYGHMSKFAFNGSKKVKPGDYLGVSGNTGMSSGPHLHFEVRKNGTPIDPIKWLKQNDGGGGKSGKWNGDIKKALKIAGLPTSGAYVKAWSKQIQTESGGNPKAHGGDDGLSDGRAKGLVQVKPGTFNAYKAKGHGNIWNGLDNLIAGMNYAKARYGKSGMLQVIGKGHGYATGTNSAKRGLNRVFEEGGEIMQMRGGETVIPNDVSIQAFKQIATSDIFNRTQTAVYDAISQYADQLREKQQVATREQQELNRLSRENTDIKEQNGLLKQLLGKMDALLNSNQNIETSNQEIRDKNYFPSSREMTKMNNENMALNAATQLMR
ncbi:peptidoglycan DD-metalloendopeptidase family protein [Staphylococcus saprophyticus]|uniref:peptidoglycan DD-metalloendopeptidase family protein n=1 Tax=Staphylococcus saprophyticus TaxID=29385 RepID=UPI001F50F29C|nr:peptidoglycan DD-metalloendopeptidase family protein [Staphylococcus saprophyticus]